MFSPLFFSCLHLPFLISFGFSSYPEYLYVGVLWGLFLCSFLLYICSFSWKYSLVKYHLYAGNSQFKNLKSRLLFILRYSWFSVGFPGDSRIKNLPANARHGFDPWVGKIPLKRKWQPTPVFLPGKSHGHRSLAGYSS